MTYVYTWLWMLISIVVCRLIFDLNTPLVEHAAGLYFSALGLFVHWAYWGRS